MTSCKNHFRTTLLALGLVLGVFSLSQVGWPVGQIAPAVHARSVPLPKASAAADSTIVYSGIQNLVTTVPDTGDFVFGGANDGPIAHGLQAQSTSLVRFQFRGADDPFQVAGYPDPNYFNVPAALKLAEGSLIGPGLSWSRGAWVVYITDASVTGGSVRIGAAEGWHPGSGQRPASVEGYLGVKGLGACGTQYGWLHIRWEDTGGIYGPDKITIIDWAYETQCNTPIAAGAGSAPPDGDDDGVADASDNCPTVANPGQENNDSDAEGDACDPDDDNDGVPDVSDAFPFNPNESVDTDGDGIGNNADPDDDNDGQSDADEIACGSNPLNAASKAADLDGDNRPDCVDPDDDGDGVADASDNCPTTPNANQANYDGDAQGDVCDSDDDNDGVPDTSDAFPRGSLLTTVVIAGCDSGVPNYRFSNGSSFNDLIGQCAASAKNHGDFVSCVSALTNTWKKDGLITGAQKGAIVSCAAGSPIP